MRGIGVGTQRLDFAEFYRISADECLGSVLVSVGDRNLACQPYPYRPGAKVVSVRPESQNPLIIHLSALLRGAGLQLVSSIQRQGSLAGDGVDLVQASPRCTGS
jgi:hypothetical protein